MANENHQPARDSKILRVLLAPADPFSVRVEQLSDEVGAIYDGAAKHGVECKVEATISTTTPDALTEAIRIFRPHVVHFTGTGSKDGQVRMNTHSGEYRNPTGPTVARAIQRSNLLPTCILFEGCRLSRQVNSLADVAENVITIRSSRPGQEFSELVSKFFYGALRQNREFSEVVRAVRSALETLGLLTEFEVDSFGQAFSRLEFERDASSEVAFSQSPKQSASAGQGVSRTDAGMSLKADGTTTSPVRDGPGGSRIYRVWFGTNRAPNDVNSLSLCFGNTRSNQVSYGHCDVLIPKYHIMGSVGDAWWRRLPKVWRDNRLSVQARTILTADEYWKQLSLFFSGLAKDDRSLLLFVHGYNTSFDDAAIRAAQLGLDLQVRGATAFFSWPSKGRAKGYIADEAAIEASETMLGEFIVSMAKTSCVDRVHLIAHSMGNRGVLRAFSDMVGRIAKVLPVPLHQVFLAAPDVDVDVFRQLAHAYTEISQRTTLYVSQKDKALLGSGILHDYPRAGFVPPITVIGGIDTVEVTSIDVSFLGHGYFANARPLLADMHALMGADLPPDKRFGLEERESEPGLKYWAIKK